LKKQRHDLVERLVEGIHKEIKKYQECILSESSNCTIAGLDMFQRINCDALSLGALTRYMLRANLWPNEIRSESTSSLDMIVQARKIEKLGESLAWSKPLKMTRTPWGNVMEQAENGDHRNCGSYSTVIELANSIEKSVQGLALSDFLRTG
jgi:hypothetical protein